MCASNPELLAGSAPESVLLRQVSGAVAEYEGLKAKARLERAREEKLAQIAADPTGPRDLKGKPKLVGRRAFIAGDAALVAALKKCKREGLGCKLTGKALQKCNPRWATKTGKPWAQGTISRWLESLRMDG